MKVIQLIYQKGLGIILKSRLTFETHLKMVTNKAKKNIGLPRKSQNLLLKTASITIYKTFVRTHHSNGVTLDMIKISICPFTNN